MTTDPTRRLSSMDLVDVAEHAHLDEWGNRAMLTQPATGVSVPRFFAAQVERTPDAVAVTFEGRPLTYRELDQEANRVAHKLTDHGAGPGSVWHCCSRGPPMRSSRSWRCSRPGRRTCRSTRRTTCPHRVHGRRCHPDRRVTTTELRFAAGRLRSDRHRYHDACYRCPAQYRVAVALARRHRPHHLHLGHHRRPQRCCGHPPQRHPTVRLARRRARVGPEQVRTQFHSYAFDFSVWEIWGALLFGGRLVVVPESDARAHRTTSTPCWSPNKSAC